MDYSIYDKTTGEFVGGGSTDAPLDQILRNPNQEVVKGTYSSHKHKVKDGVVIERTDIVKSTKFQRQQQVEQIVVTTTSGKVLDGGEQSQNRMARTLQVMELTGTTTVDWKLANNTITSITKSELEEALIAAHEQMMLIWL